MKLPLDNFQVLGVSPNSSVQNILIVLERRLERCDYLGFSEVTIRKRNDLIREASKLLLDPDKRREYENNYKAVDAGDGDNRCLDIRTGFEICGLLILLESRSFEECLNLATDSIAMIEDLPGVSTSEVNDLSLVIAYATIEYSYELKSKRYYDYCSRILERGLRYLPDSTNLLSLRARIQKELDEITPFRILDLLSRDMDDPVREDGIKILNDFVTVRGGLDNKTDLYMKDSEFKSFFRQIRYFLTVQEQIDLYQKWCLSGSQSACFLLAICLVASGFVRRKPERLIQALDIINSLEAQELADIESFISLLLGRVDIVQRISMSSEQAANQIERESSDSGLGQLCVRCREWLERDVLEGYRDLEAEPDLETYFSDRDVTNFIERIDAAPTAVEKSSSSRFVDVELSSGIVNRKSLIGEAQISHGSPDGVRMPDFMKIYRIIRYQCRKNVKGLIIGAGITLLLLIILLGIVKRDKTKEILQQNQSSDVNTLNNRGIPKLVGFAKKTTSLPKQESRNTVAALPDKSMVSTILSEWLSIKAEVLAGQAIPIRVNAIATAEAIRRLESERKEDKINEETQSISARIIGLKILRQDKKRIEFEATLAYSDERLDKDKNVLEKTPKQVFTKRYTLVKRDSSWMLE